MRALTIAAIGLVGFVWSAAPSAAGDLKIGDAAPDFSLQASNGKTYRLSDFRGKQAIVLAWFPKAYTRGCTLECKSLAEHGDLIKQFVEPRFLNQGWVMSTTHRQAHPMSGGSWNPSTYRWRRLRRMNMRPVARGHQRLVPTAAEEIFCRCLR